MTYGTPLAFPEIYWSGKCYLSVRCKSLLTVEVAHLLSSLVVAAACRDSLLRTTRLTLPPKLTGLLWLSSSKP